MKKRGTPKEAPGGIHEGEQVMWWCPLCKGVRHRATYVDDEGRRFHCWTGYTSGSSMFMMRKVRVRLEFVK